MTFSEDLKIGQEVEKRVANVLEKETGVKCLFPTPGKFSPFDFAFYMPSGEIKTAEVKYDAKASQTGNIAIEVSNNGKPSGLFVTKSDYWVHVVGCDAYLLKTEDLKNKCLDVRSGLEIEHFKRKVKGGDGWRTEMYLFDIRFLKKITLAIYKI